MTSLFFLGLNRVSIGAAVVVGWFVAHIDMTGVDKLTLFNVSVMTMAILACIALPVGIYKSNANSFISIASILNGLFTVATIIIGMSVRDIIVFDKFNTGLNREALILTAFHLPIELAVKFLTNIPVLINNADGVNCSMWGASIFSTIVVGAVLFIIFYLMYGFPLTTKIVNGLQDAVRVRLGGALPYVQFDNLLFLILSCVDV